MRKRYICQVGNFEWNRMRGFGKTSRLDLASPFTLHRGAYSSRRHAEYQTHLGGWPTIRNCKTRSMAGPDLSRQPLLKQ
jgi:hypothetical protein